MRPAIPRPAVARRVVLGLLLPLAAGCATTGAGNPADPFESINRPIFAFNDAIDQNALKPLAQGYRRFVPEPLQLMLTSFFSNLGDLYTGVNNLLQAKPKSALIDVSRFVVNSTLGFAGVADVASAIGMPKHYEDFGQTLGYWGVPVGPYIVLPFLGPSSARDAPARVVDTYGDPVAQYRHDIGLRNTGLGLRIVDTRAGLLDAERVIAGAALDRYALIRDGWLQRRRNAVYDGDAPGADAPPDYDDDESGYSSESTAGGGTGGAGAGGTGAKPPAAGAPAAGATRPQGGVGKP